MSTNPIFNDSRDNVSSFQINFERNIKEIDWLSCVIKSKKKKWRVFMAVQDYKSNLPLVRLLDFDIIKNVNRHDSPMSNTKVYFAFPKNVRKWLIFYYTQGYIIICLCICCDFP